MRPGSVKKHIRCAIYTRGSTEQGLDQDFNSLDAQRESAEAFVASQRHEGWQVLPERYDDGGYTGGNMDRPALKRLMADIEAGKVDVVVVYKIDRLTRSSKLPTVGAGAMDARRAAGSVRGANGRSLAACAGSWKSARASRQSRR